MNIRASLTRKYGPLPLYGWLAVVAAVLLVYRFFRPATATSSDSATPDTGALATGSGNLGRFAGGGDGSGLTPTDQTLADSNLTGPGTPVVYDPLTGDTNDPGPFVDDPPDVPNYTDSGIPYTEEYVRNREIVDTRKPPPPAAVPAKKKAPARPKTTRGQRAPAPAPQLISEHGKGGGYTVHPPARANKAPAAPTRTTQTATTTVERPRSSGETVVNAGARTSAPVGTTTSASTYASMGRKGEL